jgi:proline iminopeptidase
MTWGDARDLHRAEIGTGTTMLLMHGGLGLDHTYLRGAHDQLSSNIKRVYYDHRGNGRSARGIGTAEHVNWQDDAAALLDLLGERRAVIYGHSYGAWLALGFALRYPERVAGLVLCGVSAAFDYLPSVLEYVRRGDPSIAEAFFAVLERPPDTDEQFGRVWKSILPLYFQSKARSDLFDSTYYSAEGFRLGNACMATYDLRSQLHTVRTPTLVLAGVHDFITPISQARSVAAAIAGAELVEFANSGHFPFAEESSVYVDVVWKWLSANVQDSAR